MCEYRWVKYGCHGMHTQPPLGEIWSSACDAPVPGPATPGRLPLCRDKMFRFDIVQIPNHACIVCFMLQNPTMKDWQWSVNIVVALDLIDEHVGGNTWVRWMPCDEQYWEDFMYNDERGMASAA